MKKGETVRAYPSTECLVEEDSEAPPIDPYGIGLSCEHLRRPVAGRATEARRRRLLVGELLRQTEIGYQHVSYRAPATMSGRDRRAATRAVRTVSVEQHIGGLEVPEHNALRVHVFETEHDLSDVELSELGRHRVLAAPPIRRLQWVTV